MYKTKYNKMLDELNRIVEREKSGEEVAQRISQIKQKAKERTQEIESKAKIYESMTDEEKRDYLRKRFQKILEKE